MVGARPNFGASTVVPKVWKSVGFAVIFEKSTLSRFCVQICFENSFGKLGGSSWERSEACRNFFEEVRKAQGPVPEACPKKCVRARAIFASGPGGKKGGKALVL